MSRELTVLATGGAYYEAPRWHDGVWWTSDLYRKGIFTVTEGGEQTRVVDMEYQPSGLGWLPDGSMLFVSQEDCRVYRRPLNGPITLHADVSTLCKGHLNDMVVDPLGRAYVGEFGFDPFANENPKTANLIRIDPDGTSVLAADDLMFPNGSVITADGSTLIVGEGMAGKYTAFSISEDGSLSDRRDWATLSSPPNMNSFSELLDELDVIVDGCCMDAEGAMWVADVKNSRCIRVLQGGRIIDEIPAPDGQNIFACMLGGHDGSTLLLCVAPGLVDNDRTRDLAATLQTTRVDVPHAAFP